MIFSKNKKNTSSIEEKQCGFLTMYFIVVALVVFRLIVLISDERFIFLGLAIVIVLSHAAYHQFRLRFIINGFHLYLLAFTLFCYLSALWALDPRYTIGRGNTMLLTSMVIFAISICFFGTNSVDQMLKAAMWTGFIVTFYSIYYFGFKDIMLSIQGAYRLGIGGDFINPNEIGMCTAYTMIITFYYAMFKNKRLYLLLDIPAFLVVLATEGKKAFLILALGMFLLFAFKNSGDKYSWKKVVKNLGLIIVAVFVIVAFSRLPVFSAITGRFQTMFDAFMGRAAAGNSTVTRLSLINIGIDLFKEHPIGGIGINNAHFIAGEIFSHTDYYLHNNYIEMLADGGIIGFCLYYSIFVFLVIKYWKIRDFKDGEFIICFSLLIINLIMDIAAVSFLDRETYFYLLIYYTKYRIMKDKNGIKQVTSLDALPTTPSVISK